MRVSTKARHAITAMMHLAAHHGRGPLALADIAQVLGMSLSYLEQLFARLRKHGLVHGVRGPGGGYCLAVNPDEISIARIMDAVEDRSPAERERFFSAYRPGTRGEAHDMWHAFSTRLYGFLADMSLGDFIKSQQAQPSARRAMHNAVELHAVG
ncbi:MAG: Rrf2 family transcriptional regulator [Halothiobacillaceae bacterium]|jgi:Rrf2 family iron-sulfur cluster assembly transcriptional regulator|nr:MAG: Rrf2 family transcriptional regulator [Halothiobacillaceae bacterium]